MSKIKLAIKLIKNLIKTVSVAKKIKKTVSIIRISAIVIGCVSLIGIPLVLVTLAVVFAIKKCNK